MSSPEGRIRVVQTDGSVEVVAHLERRRAEAFALELRALAKRYGFEVQTMRVVPGEPRTVGAEGRGRESTQ